MKFEIDGHIVKESVDAVDLPELLENSLRQLASQNRRLSEIRIDNVPVYTDVLSYVKRAEMTIEYIQLLTVSVHQYVMDLSKQVKEYLPNLIAGIRGITDQFYGEVTNETWSYLIEIIEGMNWLSQSMHTIDEEIKHTSKPIFKVNIESHMLANMREHFETINTALENQDYVTVADIFKYELTALFEELLSQLQEVPESYV
ncbi:hypothetical protein M3650_08820 [Paenibacillus sp. MER TA 81-3]|uniref:hypothetical protein n=1 Tax=Paenibacillus sp. MER TA 81-3 TaxID=2939573 RepID=UPI002041B04F|nr:hypothetical protein [Paenibacillus sp. MER TA 81-3]MCM3338740.1 hypothetical protein [Paenibacillus sp. MER TA 81-3]